MSHELVTKDSICCKEILTVKIIRLKSDIELLIYDTEAFKWDLFPVLKIHMALGTSQQLGNIGNQKSEINPSCRGFQLAAANWLAIQCKT